MNAPARIAELERQLHWAQLKIQALEEELRQRRIQLLGPRSETLSNLQLELLADEEPGATRDEVEAESRREPHDAQPRESASRIRAASRCRRNLPRVEEVIALRRAAAAERAAEKRRSSATTKASNWMSSRRAISCA